MIDLDTILYSKVSGKPFSGVCPLIRAVEQVTLLMFLFSMHPY